VSERVLPYALRQISEFASSAKTMRNPLNVLLFVAAALLCQSQYNFANAQTTHVYLIYFPAKRKIKSVRPVNFAKKRERPRLRALMTDFHR
jgi:hypothetical protein